MLSSDQGPRNASGGLNAAGLTSRPRFGAGATVDRGLPASKYAPLSLDLHGQLHVTVSPDVADAALLVPLGKTGVHLVRPDAAFEAAGLRAADRRAIANGAAPGTTVLTPVAAALQSNGADVKVAILPNLCAVLGCHGSAPTPSAPLQAAFNLVGGAGAGVNTLHQNPTNRLVFSSRTMEVHQNLHTLTSGTFARLKRVFNERLDFWGIETANALAALSGPGPLASPPCTFNFREETLAIWVPVSEDQANLAPDAAPALGTFRENQTYK